MTTGATPQAGMTDTPDEAIPELLLVNWLKDRTGLRTSVELPANYPDVLPVTVVSLTTGVQDNFYLQRPIFEVSVYAGDRSQALATATNIKNLVLTELPNSSTPYGTVTFARCLMLPRWLPFDDTHVRRYAATYLLALH